MSRNSTLAEPSAVPAGAAAEPRAAVGRGAPPPATPGTAPQSRPHLRWDPGFERPDGSGRGAWRDGSDGEFWFDEAAADLRVRFIEKNLKHIKGPLAGQPFLLRPWQNAFVRCLFGWKRLNGSRRYRKAFLYVPRKNGKTLLLAAILICLFLLDGEQGAEIYNVAATRKQAAICFKAARQMVLNSALLKPRVEALKHAMEARRTGATWAALSSDLGGSQHGENPSGVGADELHAMKTADLIDAMTTGSLARTQPLFIFTTTADVIRESVCNAEYKYAEGVRDGLVPDPHYLPVIYEAPRDAEGNVADWTAESTWLAANPNLGVSISLEDFRAEIQGAINDPSKENRVKRLYLNIQTEQVTRWLSAPRWKDCATQFALREFREALHGRDALGALDLADRLDLSSFVLLFPPVSGALSERSESNGPPVPPPAGTKNPEHTPSGTTAEGFRGLGVGVSSDPKPETLHPAPFRCFWRHWIPEDTLTAEARKLRQHARFYGPWAQGCICRKTADAHARLDCPAHIHVTPGAVTDYDYVRADINALAARYNILEIACDKAQATQIQSQLTADGVVIFEHGQSCLAMNPGIAELERLILGKLLEHSGEPVAAWAFGNVAIYQDSFGQRRFEKATGTAKTGRLLRKIDPLQVLAMATGRSAAHADSYNAVKGGLLI